MGTLKAQWAGPLEVRLAATDSEVAAAQRLRFDVFFNEMGASPTTTAASTRRDADDFDDLCDHLLVVDHARGGVVGTYRLLDRKQAIRAGRFYSSGEYDISAIMDYPGEILELGRSCIAPAYRTGPTMQLMWRGIAAYVFQNGIDLMFGCASLHGTDPHALGVPLSYLYHHHLAPEAMRPKAVAERYTDMRIVAPEAITRRTALSELPPLVKGYLRLGGVVGDGAVIDHEFNTIDVCVIVRTDWVSEKYARHYDRTVVA